MKARHYVAEHSGYKIQLYRSRESTDVAGYVTCTPPHAARLSRTIGDILICTRPPAQLAQCVPFQEVRRACAFDGHVPESCAGTILRHRTAVPLSLALTLWGPARRPALRRALLGALTSVTRLSRIRPARPGIRARARDLEVEHGRPDGDRQVVTNNNARGKSFPLYTARPRLDSAPRPPTHDTRTDVQKAHSNRLT